MSGTFRKLKTSWAIALRIIRDRGVLSDWLRANVAKRQLVCTFGHRPVPITDLVGLRNRLSSPDRLADVFSSVTTSGSSLRNAILRRHLANTELGGWSLAADTLNFLESQIREHVPSRILEFGSGVSTTCLARFMCDAHGSTEHLWVISIEQDSDCAVRTAQLARELGIEKTIRIIHVPLRKQTIEGFTVNCYHLTPELVHTLEDGERADFIVVDGPAAEEGARLGTLPLIRSVVAPNAQFFLDDALRDGELRVAQRWDTLPYLRVHGIYLIGKGLLAGRFSLNE